MKEFHLLIHIVENNRAEVSELIFRLNHIRVKKLISPPIHCRFILNHPKSIAHFEKTITNNQIEVEWEIFRHSDNSHRISVNRLHLLQHYNVLNRYALQLCITMWRLSLANYNSCSHYSLLLPTIFAIIHTSHYSHLQIAAKIHPGGPGGNGGGGMGAGGGGMGGGSMGGVMGGGGGGGMGSGSSVGSKRSIDSDGSGNSSTNIHLFNGTLTIDSHESLCCSRRTRMQEDEQRLRLSITKFEYAASNAGCPTSKQKINRTLFGLTNPIVTNEPNC